MWLRTGRTSERSARRRRRRSPCESRPQAEPEVRSREMLRIITLNLNGIRSALAKGFPRWLARQRADVVCLQEIKAQEADLAGLALVPKGYHAYYDCCSTKKRSEEHTSELQSLTNLVC